MKWIKRVFGELDRVLRGEGTQAEQVRGGTIGVSESAMLVAVVALGMFYGACMGCYNVLTGQEGAWLQIISSALKVPALFLLTLGVTFPSLYVFNALVGSRLSFANMLRLIMAAIGVMAAVLAGFGTIIAFFNFTTTSYPFILLLNVIVFTVAGVLGLKFLLQTLRRMVEPVSAPPHAEAVASGSGVVSNTPKLEPQPRPEPEATASASAPALPPALRPGALQRVQKGPTDASVKAIFRIWVVIFALVGAQMSWVLRPFVGSYESGEFAWFRPRGGNFFQRVWEILVTLLGGGGGS